MKTCTAIARILCIRLPWMLYQPTARPPGMEGKREDGFYRFHDGDSSVCNLREHKNGNTSCFGNESGSQKMGASLVGCMKLFNDGLPEPRETGLAKITHKCRECGREYVWVPPHIKTCQYPPRSGHKEPCLGMLVPLNTETKNV